MDVLPLLRVLPDAREETDETDESKPPTRFFSWDPCRVLFGAMQSGSDGPEPSRKSKKEDP